MTDPIITAAKVDASDRERIAAGLLLLVDPADALEAAIARIAYLEERNDELQKDLAGAEPNLRSVLDKIAAVAGVGSGSAPEVSDAVVTRIRRLVNERDSSRAEVDRLAALLATAEEEAETQRQSARNLRDALDRVATAAGVADGSGDEVADRIAAAIDKLREERDQARCAAADSAHQHERLLEEHTALQRAIARIVTCPPDEEHAAMADARLLVGEAAIARYARTPTKPEPQPVATVEPATPTPRYKPVEVRDVPPGTPAVWLGLGDDFRNVDSLLDRAPGCLVWTVTAPTWATAAIIDTTPEAPGGPVDVDAADLGLVYAVGWTDAQRADPGKDVNTYDKAAFASVLRHLAQVHRGVDVARLRAVADATQAPAPAPTPPAKPTTRYAPSQIDHLIGPFHKDRYVAVPAEAAKDVPPDRVLWRSAERLASRDADELNRGDRRRDFYGWGDDSTPEVRLWAVVDRGEPIGEEG